MKKFYKNLTVFVLAFVLMLSMCMTAGAASSPAEGAKAREFTNDSTATIVVGVGTLDDSTTANGGDKLEAYKVVDVTLNDVYNTLEYEFTELFKDFQQDKTFGKGYTAMTTAEYAALDNESEALKKLLGQFAAYVKTEKIAAGMTAVANESGIASFNNVKPGQYIIVGDGTSKGAKVYQTVTAEFVPVVGKVDGQQDGKDTFVFYDTYTVAMKTAKPSIDKEITLGTVTEPADPADPEDSEKKTASIGDIVTYTLKVAVPTYPEGALNTTFYVGDLLSKGLTLTEDPFVIKGVATEDGTLIDLKQDVDYILDTQGDDKHTFYVDFDMLSSIRACAYVTIEYKAVLNEEAEIGTIVGNPNDADLVYSNSPFNGSTWKPGDTPDRPGTDENGYGHDEDKEIVYTYALVIDKYDEKMPWEKLENAVFDVYLAGSGEGAVDIPYTNHITGTKVETITTDSNGVAFLKGLEYGDYYLVETKAPAGFNLMQEAMKMEINSGSTPNTIRENVTVRQFIYTTDIKDAEDYDEATQSAAQAKDEDGNPLYLSSDNKVTTDATGKPLYVDGTTEVTEVTEIVVGGTDKANGYFEVGVPNASGAHLPGTGGMGTTLFSAAGSLLAIGAAVMLITKRRMSRSKEN